MVLPQGLLADVVATEREVKDALDDLDYNTGAGEDIGAREKQWKALMSVDVGNLLPGARTALPAKYVDTTSGTRNVSHE